MTRAGAPVAARTPLSGEQRLLAVALITAASLVAFEITAILTVLPTITDDLGGDSYYGLALAVYTLANMVAMVSAGEVLDRRGPALPFMVCMGTFVLGLVVAAAAGSMVWVVVGRFLQGANGGFSPIAYSQVKRSFPEDRQPMLYAFLSAAWVVPSLVAPAIAGDVTERVGWRWVFLGMVPVALTVGLLAVRPLLHDPGDGTVRRPSRIPLAAAAAAGIGVLLIGLQGDDLLSAAPLTVAGAVTAAVTLRRLLPSGMLVAKVGLPAVLAARLLAAVTFGGVDSFVPLAADRIHGASARVQGFVVIGAALTWSLGQWLQARRRTLVHGRAMRHGFTLLLVGVLITVPVVDAGWPLWATFLTWSVGGLGMGLLFNPATVAAMSYAAPGEEGLVGGQVNLADSIGWSLIGGLGGATVAIAGRSSWSLQGAFLTNFGIAAVAAVLGILVSRRVRVARPASA